MHEGAFVVGDDPQLAPVVIIVQVLPPEGKVPQHPAKSRFQIVMGKDCFRRPIGQHRALDQDGPVTEFRDRAQVMRRHQHHPPFVAQLAQQVDDLVLGLHVYAGKGFVQQDHLPVLRQGTRQKDPLALPAGQLSDLAVAELGHVDAAQGVVHRRMIGGFGTAQEPHMPIAPHHYHILHQHRKGPIDLF